MTFSPGADHTSPALKPQAWPKAAGGITTVIIHNYLVHSKPASSSLWRNQFGTYLFGENISNDTVRYVLNDRVANPWKKAILSQDYSVCDTQFKEMWYCHFKSSLWPINNSFDSISHFYKPWGHNISTVNYIPCLGLGKDIIYNWPQLTSVK